MPRGEADPHPLPAAAVVGKSGVKRSKYDNPEVVWCDVTLR